MTSGPAPPPVVAAASLPPPNLAELDPAWSRLVTVPYLDGRGRTFHLLDNGVSEPEVTFLCVHGNPSWSYIWRDMLRNAPAGVRVIAADHLGMGYSERTGTTRRLAQRIADLSALTDALELSGPVVTVAHDWGGPISVGWAQRHRANLAGMVLMNTAVHQPEGRPAPRLIRLAKIPLLSKQITVRTPAFVRGALALTRRRPVAEVRQAYHAPYRTMERRASVGGFVDDIPLDESHPSHATLENVAAGLEEMGDVPALLLWGARDPVFSDLYLHDLERHLPHADVHRFARAGHYLTEEVDVAGAVYSWFEQVGADKSQAPEVERLPLWSGLARRADDDGVAVLEMTSDGAGRRISFAELDAEVRLIAAGMVASGIRPGDRVALLVPPGVDLTICIYACWRMGAVTVVADAGLGLRGMGKALNSAAPDYLIGVTKALAAARTMGWPGRPIAINRLTDASKRALGLWASLGGIRRHGADQPDAPTPKADDLAAVVFTSGATGPAKGVRYRHRQAQAQRDALIAAYDIGAQDRLVAAFAPFALYGPAMGIPSVVPDMDVTKPGSLSASALGDAAVAIGASLVFASPAALKSVLATAGELTQAHRDAFSQVRLLLSAGAPVPAEVLRAAIELMPNAEAHTPYGMTEVLPVADISLTAIEDAGIGNGVCVGHPVDGVAVAIDPLDGLGTPIGEQTFDAAATGEVCVAAGHVKESYDRLWLTQHASSQPSGWHRTGDVGHIDEAGRLWIEGRLVHVITAPGGPVTPVALEQAVQRLPGVDLAAAVGVGPQGTQQVVVVVEPVERPRRGGLASQELADAVRRVATVDVAAVLVVSTLPVDKRHNSKIDRTKVAEWATGVLSGGRIGRL